MIMEAAAAFAMAQSAVKGIKKGIQLGRDINDLTKQVMAFFDAKDVIQRAATDEKLKAGKSVESEALENVMRAKQMADFEAELNRIFVLTNNAELWQMMLRERQRIRAERKSAEMAEEKKRRKVAARRKEIAEWTFIGVTCSILIVGSIYTLIKVVIWYSGR